MKNLSLAFRLNFKSNGKFSFIKNKKNYIFASKCLIIDTLKKIKIKLKK